MKYLLVIFLLFGCGHELGDESGGEEACQPYHSGYSHTVTYCGEDTEDNVQSVFILCNPRVLTARECVEDLALGELEDNCFSKNICLEDWTP